MPILTVVFIILCCGAVCFGIMHMPWVSETFKKIACALIAVCLVLWLMSLFGVFDALSGFTVGSPHQSGPVHHR